MVMKTVVENLDDIEQALREHYTENTGPNGKKEFVLVLDGPTEALPAVKSAKAEAAQNRTKLKELETKYGKISGFEGMDPTEVRAKLDRIAELEAASGGKLDDAAITKIVDGRLNQVKAPLERQIQQLTQENTGLKTQVGDFTQKERSRLITDQVRAAATELKLLPEAVDDAIMYAERLMEVDEEGVVSVKDKVGFTPGLKPKDWLVDMQQKRPHWWGPSSGGGASGSGGRSNMFGGDNPFSHEHWNMTKQNEVYRKDPKAADRLAAAAGTSVGGGRPARKKST